MNLSKKEVECEMLQLDMAEIPKTKEPNPKDVQPTKRSYQILCSVCKIVRIYKHNTSEMCPDCAADKRMKENQAKRFPG